MSTNRNFIKAARIVLQKENEPMTIKAILEKAFDENELHTIGQSPENTMRARISEHIRKFGGNSLFVRVGPNKFGLREWDLKKWNLEEYDKHPLIKHFEGENVVCISQVMIDKIGRFFGYSKEYQKFLKTLQDEHIVFLDRAEAELNDNYKQLICYVLLFNKKGEILTFKRGSYSTADKQLLEGAICIGFGGHVNKFDFISKEGNYQLFSYFDAGVEQASIREVMEELNLELPPVKSPNYIGIINDDSSPTGLRHLGIVLSGVLPDDFNLDTANTERSINKLTFMTSVELWEHFHELEFWSQLLCKAYWKKPKNYLPVVISESRKKKIDGPIAIVGEVATGKTFIADFLSKRYKLGVVSTRLCVAELTGLKDFKGGEREVFSQRALELVSTEEGISKLANRIASEVRNKGNRVIIDGIRNIRTYDLLCREFKDLTIIFVDCPRDCAYEFYKLEAKRNTTIDEFRKTRHHDVEKEVTLFKNRANIKIYNGLVSLDDLLIIIGDWFDGRIQVSS